MYLQRFNGRHRGGPGGALHGELRGEAVVSYLHALLQGLQKGGARGLQHVSRVLARLRTFHTTYCYKLPWQWGVTQCLGQSEVKSPQAAE